MIKKLNAYVFQDLRLFLKGIGLQAVRGTLFLKVAKAMMQETRFDNFPTPYGNGECAKQRLPLRYGRRDLRNPNSALIKVRASTPVPNTIDPIDKKKEPGKGILIVSASIIDFELLALTIFGIMIYRYHVRAYKRISSNEHIGLSEEVAPLSFIYAELERVTDGFKEDNIIQSM
ncbi:conserved hypothetical protein [Ricinus communis]|uniref:Uncharacterized protein n=1 Tax=Ricinus communis TaxID=3988 RepID=B9T0M4_RICCO|nr:conserved hypothetical protein [Ricinus communis]